MSQQTLRSPLEQIDACSWRIPQTYKPGMRVDGIVYADERMLSQILSDQALDQVANVAWLPGIQMASLAMPDIHWGYGFCIGGVCATDPQQGGVISPGGVGYDINCGVRLVRTNLSYADVLPRLEKLIESLFRRIPTGVGKAGHYHFDSKQLQVLMAEGPRSLIRRDLATPRDVEFTEAHGQLEGADPAQVSARAL
ncbi:MAG TPA: RtcB family protein, partial [Tepidisphaeraceae bacterium]|nr:RtcB family protein [Tepidisphaeraceae bacterium]